MGFTPAEAILHAIPSSEELTSALAAFIIRSQNEAFEKGKDSFSLAISGGSLPKQLKGLIGNPQAKWNKWHVWFADERAVPFSDKESNYKLVKEEFLQHVSIPEANVHRIDESKLGDIEELAEEYHDQLIAHFAAQDSARWPVFDLILLGMGPDGHTASLFPGSDLLDESSEVNELYPWVAPVTNSPKPPPNRVTLTLTVIKHAARVVFVATGDSKQDALQKVLDDKDPAVPSTLVVPVKPGTLHWFVDDAAASKVTYARTPFKL